MGGQGPPGTVTITLSPQDQQAINRVCDQFFFSEKIFIHHFSFSYKIWVLNAIVLLKHFLLVIVMKNWQRIIF